MKIMKLGILAFCLLSLICKSQAQVFIVHNLDVATDSTTIDPNNWRAVSFTTGSEATTLAGLVTRLGGFGETSGNSISLYDNVSNLPGSSVVSFLDNPQDLGSNNEFRLSYDGTFELAASTTYWVVFGAASGGGDYNVFWTSSTSETGDAGWSIGDTRLRSTDLGASWITQSSSSIPIGIIVPEPSEYAFAIALVMGIFILVRRRRNRMTEF